MRWIFFVFTAGIRVEGEKDHLKRRSSFSPSPGYANIMFLISVALPLYLLGWALLNASINPNLMSG